MGFLFLWGSLGQMEKNTIISPVPLNHMGRDSGMGATVTSPVRLAQAPRADSTTGGGVECQDDHGGWDYVLEYVQEYFYGLLPIPPILLPHQNVPVPPIRLVFHRKLSYYFLIPILYRPSTPGLSHLTDFCSDHCPHPSKRRQLGGRDIKDSPKEGLAP